MPIFAYSAFLDTFTVTATILPRRIIVIDDTLHIQQVISNTPQDVIPEISLHTIDGKTVQAAETVMNQYEILKPSLNFSKPGVVYTRPTFSWSRMVQNISKLFSMIG